ncbi:MAG TPA: hypothetical protein HPP66_08735 [Planctomycetes bacterium]|nr:hypothetical protein [Planctomycetota bacterium]
MSDQQMGKKEEERIGLDYFIDAYKLVTGEQLTELGSFESPDFICARATGQQIGVELTEVRRGLWEALWDRILDRKYEADAQDTLDRIFALIEKKDKTRSTNYGNWADKTILVLQLRDCSVWSLRPFLDDIREDFSGYGFVEIWLADYTEIEAYGDVELFGLVPSKWWGYHRRENPYRKPYG